MEAKEEVLKIENLSICYKTDLETVYAVNDISFSIGAGETLGLVGETGAGKTTTALGILGLLPERTGHVTGGKVLFGGENLLNLSEHEMQKVRGQSISMIFQDPMTALNPVLTVGEQIGEALYLHHSSEMSSKEIEHKVDETLELVGIPKERGREYPYQFSGGMRQRVVIAMALVCNPQLLIADEPTTALDVTIQAQIIRLIKELGQNTGTSTILITHDLGVVADICTRIDVMYAGLVMEEGKTDDVFFNPAHPYTMGLLRSIPNVATGARHRLIPIPGTPPDLLNPPQGCPFSPRCSFSMNICTSHRPGYYQVGEGHKAACWLLDKHAPCCDRYNAMKGGISSVER